MGKLKIAFFAINYAPDHFGVCPYATGIAEHYAEQGHLVTVVTGVPHYPEWRRKPLPPGYSSKSGNPRVHRYNHFIPRRAGAAGRTLYEATWLASAMRVLPLIGADVAIGIVPSLSGAALARLASLRCRVPYGVLFQDLMGPSAAQSGYRGGGRVAGLASRAELALARGATCVGVISEAFAPYLECGGVSAGRIVVTRNWARHSAPLDTREAVRRRLKWSDDEFVCLHAGTMGQKQGLDNVVSAAELLQDESVRFVFAGDGNDRSRLESTVASRGLKNVQFLDPHRPGHYESLLAAADLLILNQRASVDEMSLPSKLTSYFASGRPTLAAVAQSSASGREIQAAGAGLVVDPDHPRQLADAVRNLRADPGYRAALGGRGKTYVESNLSPESSFEQYDLFLRRTLGEDAHVANREFEVAVTGFGGKT